MRHSREEYNCCHPPVLEHPRNTTTLGPVTGQGNPVSRTRLLLADDNTGILDQVSDMLRTDYEIIGKLADGDSVCAAAKRLLPNLIILDISMGEHSGIEICQQLHEQGYVGEIVFLTVHDDTDFVDAAIGAGGRGYVIKSRMATDLELALQAVLSHKVFISPLMHEP